MLNFIQVKEATIQNIFNAGLTVKGKYIYKTSNVGKQREVAGILNEKTVHFYASNLPHSIEPKNYTYTQFNRLFSNDVVIVKDYTSIINSASETTLKKELKFEQFTAVTNTFDHNFDLQILIDKFKTLNKNYIDLPEYWSNISDIRGLKGSTFFPIIDFQNNFITAQSIFYDANFKRNKTKYISWLHSNYDFKNYIGISTKIAPKSDICFYREHLIDLKKPTIIVEAPKTAELGALILPNFNWIATLGATRFEGLDVSFLDSKNTFVLPDNDKLQEWQIIANKKGFKTIKSFYQNTKNLENFESSDFADLIIPYLTEARSDIDKAFKMVYSAILSIKINITTNDFQIDQDIINATEFLCFEVNQKKVNNFYVSSIPSNLSQTTTAIYKHSNPEGIRLKTKNFEIFKDDFNVLDAGFNIRKSITELQFINNLRKCFLIIKHLNISDDYLHYFDLIVSNIQTNGAYKFNRNGIKRLINIFDALPIENALNHIKKRNYIYKGSESRIDNLEFIKQLRQAQLKYKTWSQLNAIKNVVEIGKSEIRFIIKKELGIKRNDNNTYISNLVDKFNIASIGTSNIKTAKVFLNVNNKIVPLRVQTNSTIIGLHSLRYKNVNISKIASDSGLLRKNIKAFINIERNIETINLVWNELSFYIENIDMLEIATNGKYFECISNPLHFKDFIPLADAEPIREKQFFATWNDAFNTEYNTVEIIKDDDNGIFQVTRVKRYKSIPINYDSSVLNINIEYAIKNTDEFILSWYLFQNKHISESDRELLKNDKKRTANFVKDIFYHNLDINYNEKLFYKFRKSA